LLPTIQPKKVKYASFVVGNSAISRNYIGYVVRNLNILIKKDLSYVSGNNITYRLRYSQLHISIRCAISSAKF